MTKGQDRPRRQMPQVWVKQHLGRAAYKRLILTHHKDLLSGHFLVSPLADRFITARASPAAQEL